MEKQSANNNNRSAGIIILLSVLTFIWSGMWAILHLASMFFTGVLIPIIRQPLNQANIRFLNNIGDPLAAGVLIGFFFLILRILSIIGAAKMMSLKKSGFILYVIPNGITLLLNVFLFGLFSDALFSVAQNIAIPWLIYIFFSTFFMLIYSFQLKKMK